MSALFIEILHENRCRGNRRAERTLRLLPDYRPCDQCGDYPERHIDQQQVDRELRPAMLKTEKTQAAHGQEECKQRQHGREEVEKTEEVKPRPEGPYQQPERYAPQAAPEKRLV